MQNGLEFSSFCRDVFEINNVDSDFDFVESSEPDFIIFGPYGDDIPPKGRYIRIGYFCENMIPDLSCCEWAFGVMREEEIGHPNYRRIHWHATDPQQLVKDLSSKKIDQIVESHTRFCNFVYSNQVPYREKFFRLLNKYKKVDAPGKSMNNMPAIAEGPGRSRWQSKKDFLSGYKFTISFENYCYPGYCTEKLYDAMLADSIPIYCGDPMVGQIFDTRSFLNAPDYLKTNLPSFVDALAQLSQPDLKDVQPSVYKSPAQRAVRKLKTLGRSLKTTIQYSDFSDLVDRIIEIDQNESLYRQYLGQPWLINNAVPEAQLTRNRWNEIFTTKPVS